MQSGLIYPQTAQSPRAPLDKLTESVKLENVLSLLPRDALHWNSEHLAPIYVSPGREVDA